jgi:endonuclease YncB( thermonuclease family)
MHDRRLFLVVAVAATLFAEDLSAKVVGITDGGTIRVMHNGALESIRLWGIDCPESKHFALRKRGLFRIASAHSFASIPLRTGTRGPHTIATALGDG